MTFLRDDPENVMVELIWRGSGRFVPSMCHIEKFIQAGDGSIRSVDPLFNLCGLWADGLTHSSTCVSPPSLSGASNPYQFLMTSAGLSILTHAPSL